MFCLYIFQNCFPFELQKWISFRIVFAFSLRNELAKPSLISLETPKWGSGLKCLPPNIGFRFIYNDQSVSCACTCYHWLNVSGNSEIIHTGLLIKLPYWYDLTDHDYALYEQIKVFETICYILISNEIRFLSSYLRFDLPREILLLFWIWYE